MNCMSSVGNVDSKQDTIFSKSDGMEEMMKDGVDAYFLRTVLLA